MKTIGVDPGSHGAHKQPMEPHAMQDAAKEALGHLHKAKEEIQALSGPLRENRDTLVRAGLDDQTDGIMSRIKEIETGLICIENAIGVLSIALGGKPAPKHYVLPVDPIDFAILSGVI